MLSSSDCGAQLAAHFGLPYAYAYFFSDGKGAEQAMHLYRTLYPPSQWHPAQQGTLCVWTLVADTEEEARHLALSRDRWRVDRTRELVGSMRAPDAVAVQGFTSAELEILKPMRRKAFVGAAKQIGERLRTLVAQFQFDELVINAWVHDPPVRRRSYELLAGEFDLVGAPPAARS